MRRLIITTIIIIFTLPGISQSEASKDTLRKHAVKVFLDCRTCDMNYTRQEIPYVNYVRDVTEAEVYILVTSQNAGNGGNQYTYTFHGQLKFDGVNDTLVMNTSPDQTSSIIRERRTNLLKMGLMRYVARTPLANEISISHNEDIEQEEVTDKWDNWLFEISSSPRFSAEESAKRFSIYNSIEVSRITPDYKLEIEVDQSFNRRKYIDDGEETVYIKTDESVDVLFVKSLGEHWSAGINWENNASTEENFDYNIELMPAVEYDLFPYSEATRRQLRFLYSIGYEFSDYIDTTTYFKTKEDFFKHRLRIAYQVQQKWGSINISLSETNFLNDMSRNVLSLSGNVRLRILKGLSLSLNGSASYNNFQPNLPKGELTEAEILLQLKQQRSAYFFQGGISLTYTFGSIYNNVVNPRFGNGGGGGGGGMYED